MMKRFLSKKSEKISNECAWHTQPPHPNEKKNNEQKIKQKKKLFNHEIGDRICH